MAETNLRDTVDHYDADDEVESDFDYIYGDYFDQVEPADPEYLPPDDESDLELDITPPILPSTPAPTPTTLASQLHSLSLAILSYFVAAVIVAYFFIQAMEAITFLMRLTDDGIALKFMWVAFLLVAGIAGAFIASLWCDAGWEGFE